MTPGNIRVPVDVTDSAQDIATTLAAAIPGGGTELLGNGAIFQAGATTTAAQPIEIFNIINNTRQDPKSFESFEIEMGYTFVVPSSGAIADGETFDITDHNGTTLVFEFDYDDPANVTGTNERIFIEQFESAATVAGKMATAIEASALAVTTHQRGERLNLEIDGFNEGAIAVTLNAANTNIGLEGNYGTTNGSAVYVHERMTRNQVADELNRITEGNVYGPTIVVPDGSFFRDDYWSSGAAVREADWFAIGDGANMSTFEFDSGIVLSVPAGIALSDGVTVNFTDGTESRIFEFDKDVPGSVSDPTTVIPVTITAIDTTWEVAQKLSDDINASNAGQPLQLTAEVIDGARVLVRSNLEGTRAEVSTKVAIQELTFAIPDGTGTDPDISNLSFDFALEVFDSLANSMGNTAPVNYDPALEPLAVLAHLRPHWISWLVCPMASLFPKVARRQLPIRFGTLASRPEMTMRPWALISPRLTLLQVT